MVAVIVEPQNFIDTLRMYNGFSGWYDSLGESTKDLILSDLQRVVESEQAYQDFINELHDKLNTEDTYIVAAVLKYATVIANFIEGSNQGHIERYVKDFYED